MEISARTGRSWRWWPKLARIYSSTDTRCLTTDSGPAPNGVRERAFGPLKYEHLCS